MFCSAVFCVLCSVFIPRHQELSFRQKRLTFSWFSSKPSTSFATGGHDTSARVRLPESHSPVQFACPLPSCTRLPLRHPSRTGFGHGAFQVYDDRITLPNNERFRITVSPASTVVEDDGASRARGVSSCSLRPRWGKPLTTWLSAVYNEKRNRGLGMHANQTGASFFLEQLVWFSGTGP